MQKLVQGLSREVEVVVVLAALVGEALVRGADLLHQELLVLVELAGGIEQELVLDVLHAALAYLQALR